MKNLMNLKGAKLLSKVEQKSINGGGGLCIDQCGPNSGMSCGGGQECVLEYCFWNGQNPIPTFYLCIGVDLNQ